MSAANDITNFVKSIFNVFDRFEEHKEMRAVGEHAADLIRVRTRLGYGVPDQGEARQKLKKLSQKYMLFRGKKSDELYEDTTPKRSNLTFTGQLINSLKVKKVKKGEVIVGPSGKRSGESLTNEKLAEYVEDAGRPFNYLSNLEVKKVERFVRKTFGDLVKRANI